MYLSRNGSGSGTIIPSEVKIDLVQLTRSQKSSKARRDLYTLGGMVWCLVWMFYGAVSLYGQPPLGADEVAAKNSERQQLKQEIASAWRDGEVDTATAKLLKLLAVETVQFGEDAERLADIHRNLSNYYLEAGNIDVAREHIEQSCRILRGQQPADSWQASEARRRREVFDLLVGLEAAQRQQMFDLDRQMNQDYESFRWADMLAATEEYARLMAQIVGDRHPAWVNALTSIQTAHLIQGNLEQVDRQLAMLVSTLQQIEHPSHPSFAVLAYIQAAYYDRVDNNVAALQYSLQAIEQFERSGATYDANYPRALQLYASVLRKQEEQTQSLSWLRKAYRVWRSESDLDGAKDDTIGSEFCEALEKEANVAFNQQQWTLAEGMYGEALQTAVETWGEMHYRVTDLRLQLNLLRRARAWSAAELENYAQVLSLLVQAQELISRGDYTQAATRTEECYAIVQQLSAPEASERVRVSELLLRLYIRTGQFNAADEFPSFRSRLLNFVGTYAAVFGEDRPDYAEFCLDIALYLGSSDPAAVGLARQSIEAYRRSLTEISDEYLEAMTQLGLLLAEQEDASCVPILDEAIELWESCASRGCYLHCQAAATLGLFHYETDDPYAARIALSRAISLFRERSDEHPLELAMALNNLANVYLDRGAYEDALAHYQQALNITGKQEWDPQHDAYELRYQWLLYNTGMVYYYLQRYVESEQLLRKLLQRLPQGEPNPDDIFRSGSYYLSKTLQRQGRLEEAERVLQQATIAVEQHFARDSIDYAELLLEQAGLAISQGEATGITDALQRALTAFEAVPQAKEFGESSYGFFLTLVDRLIAHCERTDHWELVLAARELELPFNEAFLDDQPWIMAIERQWLADARLVVAATAEQRKLLHRLREVTEELDDGAQHGYVDFTPLPANEETKLVDACCEVLGDNNLPVAEFRKALVAYWEHQQQYRKAVTLQEYVFETFYKLFGDDHPYPARAGVVIGRLARKIGGYQLAKQVLDISLPVLHRISGEHNDDTLVGNLELAKLHVATADYAAALPLALEVERQYGGVWGKTNRVYSDTLETLGMIYLGMNEPALAAENFSRARDVLKDLGATSDQRWLRASGFLAIAQAGESNDRAAIREMFDSVLSLYRETNQTQLVDYAELLLAYADVLTGWGEHAQAEQVFQRAWDAVVELDGMADDVLRGTIAAQAGSVRRKLGKLSQAHVNLTFAVATHRKVFGDDSQQLSEALFQLALVEHILGHHALALPLIEESLQIERRYLSSLGNLVSEKSLTPLLGGDESRLDVLLSVLLALRDEEQGNEHGQSEGEVQQENQLNSHSASTAFAWTMHNKGLALDLSCRFHALQQSRQFDSRVVQLVGRIRLLNQEMADLALLQSQQRTATQLAQQRSQLASQIAQANSQLALLLPTSDDTPPVEIELSGVTAGDDETLQPAKDLGQADLEKGIAKVRGRLADMDCCYLEFVRTQRWLTVDNQPQSVPHWVVFYVPPQLQQPIEMVDLGPEQTIAASIETLRETTRSIPQMLRISSEEDLEQSYRQPAKQLYQMLLGPFADRLQQASALIISPDAALSTLSFAALVDADDKYLVETIDLSYVSSARDLLRQPASAGSGTLILADPNYDANPDRRREVISSLQHERLPESLLAARSAVVTRGMEDVATRSLRWRRLPGAAAEADDVAELLTGSQFEPIKSYADNEAVEEVLKAIQSPRLVHIATHGFYVALQQERNEVGESQRGLSFSSGLSRLRGDSNPLLRSGIVLAGANRLADMTDDQATSLEDGWVTAQEIVGMDFRHTQLVVLSACESGLGDLSNGQGVQGLRRSFINAGAHAVLTSLFEVPDDETRQLMRGFYQTLPTTPDLRHALCQSQRELIASRRQQSQAAHPFFWASFILLGAAQEFSEN